MSGAFARGAQNDEKIGIVNNTATLTVPAQNVDGKSFRAHESGSGGMSNIMGEISIFNGYHSKKRGLTKTPSHLAGHSHGRHGSTANPAYFLGAGLDKKQNIGKKKIPIPVFNKAKMFDGAITGTHTLPEQDLNLSTPKNQPPHVVGEWIMRIE